MLLCVSAYNHQSSQRIKACNGLSLYNTTDPDLGKKNIKMSINYNAQVYQNNGEKKKTTQIA